MWSGVINTKTTKLFLCRAAQKGKIILQIDYIGSFLQAKARQRLFVNLPPEFKVYFPEFAQYFDSPQLLDRAMYGKPFASKSWNDDVTEFLIEDGFVQSSIDCCLYIKRYPDGRYIEMWMMACILEVTEKLKKNLLEG